MTKFIATALVGVLLVAGSAPVAAFAQDAKPAAAAPAGKLSSNSMMSALLANDKSRAILEKNIPIIVQYSDMIPGLDMITLKQLASNDQAQSGGGLTADVLKTIEGELAKL